MSWNQVQILFDGQGLVFWAAVTAVALGLTLLSVSIVFQIRRLVVRTSWRGARHQSVAKPKPATVSPQVVATEEGYRPLRPARAAEQDKTPAADPLLESLLVRLKKSGDRLERLHSSLGPGELPGLVQRDSLLKETPEEVDYVYQAGRA